MARRGRGEPMGIPDSRLTKVIEQIFGAMKALLPEGREVDALRGLNKKIAHEIAAREDHNDSLDGDSESDDVPVPQGLLGSRASLRSGHLRGKQGKRVAKDLNHRPIPRAKSSSLEVPFNLNKPVYREDSETLEEEDNSSEGTDDSDFVHARTSRSAPRHIARAAKQRKRVLSSHKIRSTTLADPTVIQSSHWQIPSANPATAASHLEMIVKHDAKNKIYYKCPKCPQTKRGRKTLEEHMICHGMRGTFRCPDCDFATSSKVSYHSHLSVHLEPSQRKQRRERGYRNKVPSSPESEIEISPERMPSSQHNGHSGVPCISNGCRYVAINCRALAEHVQRVHPFSPGQSTSGIPQRRRIQTDNKNSDILEFRCSDCPEAFLFKTHLKLHRRHKHPGRRGRPRKSEFPRGKK